MVNYMLSPRVPFREKWGERRLECVSIHLNDSPDYFSLIWGKEIEGGKGRMMDDWKEIS